MLPGGTFSAKTGKVLDKPGQTLENCLVPPIRATRLLILIFLPAFLKKFLWIKSSLFSTRSSIKDKRNIKD